MIEKIFKLMTVKKYTQGQYIYKENTSTVDGVYFITEGEFELT